MDLKPVYTAPSESAALDRFAEFSEKWEARYPAIVRLWEQAWASSCRSCSSTPKSAESSAPPTIESRNARYRRAVPGTGALRPSKR